MTEAKSRQYAVYVQLPFDLARKELTDNHYRIISLEENARLRIEGGQKSQASRHGNWTREGVLHIPGEGIYLTKNSPVLKYSEEAVKAHGREQEFELSRKQIGEYLDGSMKIKRKGSIPTNKFGEDGFTVFIFGK